MFFVPHLRQLLPSGLVGLMLCCPNITFAYTPDSREVRSMVQRGVRYIEEHYPGTDQEELLAEVCVSGLACYAAQGELAHPVVSKAIAAVRATTQAEQVHDALDDDDFGRALIFVSSVDAELFRQDVEWLLNALYGRQRADGGWGESEQSSAADLLTTKTICFGMWMSHRQGIEVREPSVMRTVNWLLDRQRDDGSFDDVAGAGEQVQSQTPTERQSRTAAALSSLYVCGDIFGWLREPTTMRRRDGHPIAVVPVVPTRTCFADEAHWQRALNRGNQWLVNFEREEVRPPLDVAALYPDLQVSDHYAAIHARLGNVNTSSNSYDRGVEFLREKQLSNGSWSGDRNSVLDTAHGVLFLARHTDSSVVRLFIERTICFPSRKLTEEDNRRVSEILKWLESGRGPYPWPVLEVKPIVLSSDPRQRHAELVRLRSMVVKGSNTARWTAAATLGTVRDLDSVPALIEALKDPDHRVIVAARDALRFMSRKPEGFMLEVVGGRRPSIATLEEAQEDWKEWLRSVKLEMVRE